MGGEYIIVQGDGKMIIFEKNQGELSLWHNFCSNRKCNTKK